MYTLLGLSCLFIKFIKLQHKKWTKISFAVIYVVKVSCILYFVTSLIYTANIGYLLCICSCFLCVEYMLAYVPGIFLIQSNVLTWINRNTVPGMCQHMSHMQKAGTCVAHINDSGYVGVGYYRIPGRAVNNFFFFFEKCKMEKKKVLEKKFWKKNFGKKKLEKKFWTTQSRPP